MTKLVVFSICQNEAETIGEVLDNIPAQINGVDEIMKLVISDGSIDDTVAIVKERGVKVYDGVQPKGLAHRFQQAVDMVLSEGADIAVGIDGDMQFNPRDIPKLVRPIIDEGYDFVSANRFARGKPKNMPSGKYWANRLGAWVVSKLSGKKFADVTCGFRAYNKKALLSLNLNSKHTYTQESFQVLAAKNMNIYMVPVDVKYFAGRKSRVVKSFSQFLFGSAINILRAFRDFAPLKFFGLLGSVPFLAGSILGAFVAWQWIVTGSLSPYKALGFIAAYLFSIGLVLWVMGLVADMFNRTLNNQEKILQGVKEAKYSKKGE